MKNEFGHIIKKKVENSSLAPPPMDWKGLSNAQNNIPKPSKSILGSKTGLIITGCVSVIVTTVLISLFVFSSEEKINQPTPELNNNTLIIDSASSTTNKITRDTIPNIIVPIEPEPIKEEKKANTPAKKKKKKDTFEIHSKKANLESVENKKTESTTTIIYEVDTITTETYIYE